MCTIQIEILEKFHNVEPQLVELSNLTILTGHNGAGKSNFLTAISMSAKQRAPNQKKYATVRINGIEHTDIVFSSLANFVENVSPLGVGQSDLHANIVDALEKFKHFAYKRDPTKEYFGYSGMVFDAIKHVANKLNKKPEELEYTEVLHHFYLYMSTGEYIDAFFKTELSDIFLGYYNLKDENELRLLRRQRGEEIDCCETEEEFLDRYGPEPWRIINDALEEARLKYRVTFPHGKGHKANFYPTIKEEGTGITLDFNYLSSGEKTLFRIVIALFNWRNNLKLPTILLLDEVDASLHPEMIIRLIKILKNVFVEKFNIKVIITTHSPTTVALSGESNIFTINDGCVTKCTKDKALSLLLSGVSNIKVLYENRKQIFVESKFDVEFFECIEEKFKSIFGRNNSYLNFISSGNDGSGSSDQVKRIVQSLKSSGVPSVYGIIDWDKVNCNSEYIYALGTPDRHSRENYTFDPLYMGLLIIRDKLFDGNDEKWFSNIKISDVNTFDKITLQKIYDYILVKKYKMSTSSSKMKAQQLAAGFNIDCSVELMEMRGHDLAEKAFQLIPRIKCFRRHEDYERAVYTKIFYEHEKFLYESIYEPLRRLHDIPMQS